MFYIFVSFAVIWITFACGAQEFYGDLYTELSWAPDEGCLFSSVLRLGVELGSLDLSTKLKIKENVFSDLELGFTWYERPLRLSGEASFKGSSFYKGALKVRYWKDPWWIECKGGISAEEPPFLEFSGTYDAEIEVKWFLSFKESLSEFKASLDFPLSEKSELSLSTRIKEKEHPVLKLRWEGETQLGDLTIEFENLSFTYAELINEWSLGEWVYEMGFYFDAQEETIDWAHDATFYRNEESGYEISLRLRKTDIIEIRRLRFCLFGSSWEGCIECVGWEISFEAERELREDITIEGEIYIDPELWEGNIRLEGLEEGIEYAVSAYFEDGVVDEVSWELGFEF